MPAPRTHTERAECVGGKPTIFTRRTLSVAGAHVETERLGYGSERLTQRIVTVKTGSPRMRREFFRQCNRLRIEWEHIGTDAHAEERRDRDGANRELLHGITSEFLVWGTMWDLDKLISCAMGEGKPIARESDVILARVVGSSGSGPMGETVAKRVRDSMRPKFEREARALREELNRVPETSAESPYRADADSVLRGRAERAFPRFVDTNDPRIPGATLAMWFEALFKFIREENREPVNVDELRQWMLGR